MRMNKHSRLHLPRAPARPGETPDFSYVHLSPAGAVPRPEVNARARDIEPLVGRAGAGARRRAARPWVRGIRTSIPRDLQVGLRHMMLTRMFDDRMQRKQRAGKISFYIRSLGEEAVSVAQCMALRPGDMLFPVVSQSGPAHRARHLAGGHDVPAPVEHARHVQGPAAAGHVSLASADNIFSISGNLATQFPQAVGWAMAAAIKGEDHLAATWIGEGSSAEADFHHALLFASVYQAPVILNVVNNQWAISTFQGYAGGEQRSFAARGPGYGIAGIRVDGNDFLAVYAVTQWAAERARTGARPDVDRAGHLSRRRRTRPATIRRATAPRTTQEYWPLGDPIQRLKQHLISIGEWSEERHQALAAELEALVAASWKEAASFGTMTEGPRLDCRPHVRGCVQGNAAAPRATAAPRLRTERS